MEPDPLPKELSREDLYELVWTSPATKLAAQTLHFAFRAVRPNGLPRPEHFATLFPAGKDAWKNPPLVNYMEKVVNGQTQIAHLLFPFDGNRHWFHFFECREVAQVFGGHRENCVVACEGELDEPFRVILSELSGLLHDFIKILGELALFIRGSIGNFRDPLCKPVKVHAENVSVAGIKVLGCWRAQWCCLTIHLAHR